MRSFIEIQVELEDSARTSTVTYLAVLTANQQLRSSTVTRNNLCIAEGVRKLFLPFSVSDVAILVYESRNLI